MTADFSDAAQAVRQSPTGRLNQAIAILPGLGFACVVAGLSFAFRELPGLAKASPMILAIALGMALNNLAGTPVAARKGVAFAARRVLRAAIVLLGLQLTFQQLVAVGPLGLAVIVLSLGATFAFTLLMGRALGVGRELAVLIAAGTSICGASAVVATNTVTDAKDEDVAYAVACVTVFGSVAMGAYPLLSGVLHLSAHDFGLWAGASIHEIAQVVACAFQQGREAGEFGTTAKLARVLLLAPVVLGLRFVLGGTRAGGGTRALPFPWFVVGFVALAALSSVFPPSQEIKAGAAQVTSFLLTVSLGALGLETDFRRLRQKGPRPFLLGLLASLFIAAASFMLIYWLD